MHEAHIALISEAMHEYSMQWWLLEEQPTHTNIALVQFMAGGDLYTKLTEDCDGTYQWHKKYDASACICH